MKNKLITTIFIMIIVGGTLFAAESSTYFGAVGAYYFDDNKGDGVSDGAFAPISYSPVVDQNPYLPSDIDQGRDLGNGWGGAEAKASITHKIKVPFMKGTGALSADNNILYQFKGELSPVSINAIVSATLTPIAFLNFQAGTQLGTGWNFFGLFNGLGLNKNGTGIPEEDPVPGIVSKSWLSGTFQFDLGAIIPGEWTHIIMAATAKVEHEYFSGANAEEAWQYEADPGENFNGFNFWGTYVLGYQLPYKLNTVAFLVETEQMIGDNKDLSSSDPVDWGSDFTQVTFGPLANIKLSEDSSLLILVQFRTEKLFTDATIYNNYFRTREYIGSYVDFRRIAFSYSQKL
ncbi:MAG: hypothetical protein PF693_03280 [Spirochaetia bacterium]|jgi:hypothetical protein|nr:hypothetical protein [Spirochaetia bacterium]